jgi:hypothetical protein
MTSSSTLFPSSSPFLDNHEHLAFVDPTVSLSYTSLSPSQRFSIRLAERHTRDILTPLFLARDISKLQQFVDHGIYLEQERFDICSLPFDWKSCICLIVQRYHDAEYPRTDFVTRRSLLILLVTAALVDRLGGMARYNYTVEFACFLAYAESLFLGVQREARGCEAVLGCAGDSYRRMKRERRDMLEHRRVLDHGDNGYRTPGRWAVRGNEERVRWIVELRLRIWGRGVEPLGPRPRA